MTDWLDGRLPGDWFTAFSVTVDREEILIDGVIGEPDSSTSDGQSGRIRRFREETRARRVAIARELHQHGLLSHAASPTRACALGADADRPGVTIWEKGGLA